MVKELWRADGFRLANGKRVGFMAVIGPSVGVGLWIGFLLSYQAMSGNGIRAKDLESLYEYGSHLLVDGYLVVFPVILFLFVLFGGRSWSVYGAAGAGALCGAIFSLLDVNQIGQSRGIALTALFLLSGTVFGGASGLLSSLLAWGFRPKD